MSTVETQTDAPSYVKWRYHVDPEFKAKILERTRKYIVERRQNDADFDEKLKEYWREYARKVAEKRANNPELAEKRREYMRMYHQRKKAERQAQQALS